MDLGECRVKLGEEAYSKIMGWIKEEVEKRVKEEVKDLERRIKKEIKRKVEAEVEERLGTKLESEDDGEAKKVNAKRSEAKAVKEKEKEDEKVDREKNIVIRELKEKLGDGVDEEKVEKKLTKELGIKVRIEWAKVIGVKGDWVTIVARCQDTREKDEILRVRREKGRSVSMKIDKDRTEEERKRDKEEWVRRREWRERR